MYTVYVVMMREYYYTLCFLSFFYYSESKQHRQHTNACVSDAALFWTDQNKRVHFVATLNYRHRCTCSIRLAMHNKESGYYTGNSQMFTI